MVGLQSGAQNGWEHDRVYTLLPLGGVSLVAFINASPSLWRVKWHRMPTMSTKTAVTPPSRYLIMALANDAAYQDIANMLFREDNG